MNFRRDNPASRVARRIGRGQLSKPTEDWKAIAAVVIQEVTARGAEPEVEVKRAPSRPGRPMRRVGGPRKARLARTSRTPGRKPRGITLCEIFAREDAKVRGKRFLPRDLTTGTFRAYL